MLVHPFEDIAAKGYGIDNHAIILGGVCVATPIHDRTGSVIFDISDTVLSTFLTNEL